MKKIIINGISLTWSESYGVQRNTLELLKELDKLANNLDIEVVVPKNANCNFSFNNIKISKSNITNKKNKLLYKITKEFWALCGFNNYVKKQDGISCDLTLTMPYKGCNIVMIYDCITERFKDNAKTLLRKLNRLLYILKVRNNLKTAQYFLTDSYYARDDIADYYNYPKEKIEVIYCGWQHFLRIKEDNSVLDKYNLKEKGYFFSLGSRYPHKNFRWIKEAAKQNPNKIFVISGSKQLNTGDKELEGNKLNNLIFTGYLKDEEIKSLMKNAIAFIQPSFYEGFGIPPMEAMSVGTNCIVSNTSALPEVYKDSVWYIDPNNYKDIDLDLIMSEKKEDNEVILERYSWKTSAKKLYDVFYKASKE